MKEDTQPHVTTSITDLPFNRHLGLIACPDGSGLIELPAGPQYLNHIGTVHAGALLALAEAASGEFLMHLPGLPSDLIPVVRRLESKFRKPAEGRVVAQASADAGTRERLDSNLASKGRSLVSIRVELYDESGVHVLSAVVDWYLQKFDQAGAVIRFATERDIPAIEELIQRSVHGLQSEHYSLVQREAALGRVFGVDRDLIRDGTYFVTEAQGRLVGCGGWSRRRAVFGGSLDRVDENGVLNPASDAARIRAFFVHPDFARRGIGSLLLRVRQRKQFAPKDSNRSC